MQNLEQVLNLLQTHKKDLKNKYYVRNIGVFGSLARGEEKPGSDIDVLVNFDRPIGLLTFVALKNYLSGLTQTPVDLVMDTSLKPAVRKNVEMDVRFVA